MRDKGVQCKFHCNWLLWNFIRIINTIHSQCILCLLRTMTGGRLLGSSRQPADQSWHCINCPHSNNMFCNPTIWIMRIMNSCTAFGAWANDHQYYILKVRVSHLLISSLKTKHNHEGTSWTQASDKHTKYFWRWKNSTNISKFQIPFWPCCSAQRKKLFWGVFLSTT